MERFQKLMEPLIASADPQTRQAIQTKLRYIETGDPAALKAAAGMQDFNWLLSTLIQGLQPPGALDVYDRRLLTLISKGDVIALRDWIGLLQSRPGEAVERAFEELKRFEFTEAQFDALAVHCEGLACDERSGEPTAVGRRLLGLTPERLRRELAVPRRWLLYDRQRLKGLVSTYLDRNPELFKTLVTAAKKELNEEHFLLEMLGHFGKRFEPEAAEYFRRDKSAFQLGMKLLDFHHDLYAVEVARRLPKHFEDSLYWGINIILPKLGPLAVGPVVERLSDQDDTRLEKSVTRQLVAQIAEHGKEQARDGLMTLARAAANSFIRAAAIEELIKLKDPSLQEALETAIEKGMDGEARDAARFAVLATQFAGGRLRERLWTDVSGKSKLLREAAAEALATGDADAFARASSTLADPSKETRLGAVLVLGKLNSPTANDVLLHRLPQEEAEVVRDEMSRVLREAGVGLETIVLAMGPIDLQALMDKAAAVRTMPVRWLDLADLPPLSTKEGKPLDPALVKYLFHRQSKQKEPVIDFDAAPLYAMIDRRTSGDFAYKVLAAFLDADAPKGDTWAMIVAAALGDNRVITTLTTRVRGWAQDFSLKLGEWGIEALGVNASDAALLAVESIASKFKDNPRRKFKVIGEAAQAAIELAAKRLGITMDERGDRVVPTLGFEPGRPRRIEAGKKKIDATIGLDFKLSMVDVDTGKRAASIPKAAGADVVVEFKGLGKLLQEIGKSQSARLEGLMVRRHRWIGARWRELFLQHPVLLPFGVRLVWGVYDDAGSLQTSFRALPDRSLTDAADESIDAPSDGAPVGIVHPLDLTAEQIAAWQTHVSDYEIEPPFMQIDRPVVRVSGTLCDAMEYKGLKGTKLHGFSFRGKAEKSGWVRAGVGDGGMVEAFRKRFANEKIDAFVTIDGLPVYADPSAEVTIGTILFLTLDESAAGWSERRIKLGDLPEIVFSEAVGDAHLRAACHN